MKQIKYNAWQKEDKIMYYWDKQPDIDHLFIDTGLGLSQMFEDKGLIWLEYIGIKDKKGDDLVEGDIVKYKNKTYIVDFWPEPMAWGVIPSDKNWLGTEEDKDMSWLNDNPLEVFQEVKIIGNKFDNPELLK